MLCRRSIVLTLAVVCVAGCTGSDRRGPSYTARPWPPSPGTGRWGSVSNAAFANAREAETPSILPDTHLAAGRLFESQGLIRKAILQYRKAIAVNHNYTEAYYRLGLLLSITGQREEALKTMRQAVKLKPDDAVLRNNLGFELLLNRQWAEAERELSEAIRLKPGFPRAYVNLGIVQSKLGRFDDALASFRAVLPEADAHYNLGLMYRSQRRYGEAAAAFRRVLSIDSRFVAAQTQLEELVAHLEPQTPLDPDIRVTDSDTETKDLFRTQSEPHPVPLRTAPPFVNGSIALRPAGGVLAAPTPDDADAADELAAVISILENELSCIERHFVEQTEGAYRVDDRGGLVVIGVAGRFAAGNADDQQAGEEPVETANTSGISDRLESRSPGQEARSPGNEPLCYAEAEVPVSPADPLPRSVPEIRHATVATLTVEADSSIDSFALLEELEEQLSILQNEIACLEEIAEEAGAAIAFSDDDQGVNGILDPPPLDLETDSFVGPPVLGAAAGAKRPLRRLMTNRNPEEKLIVDMVDRQPTAGLNRRNVPHPPGLESLLRAGNLQPVKTDTSPAGEHGKSATPGPRPLSWLTTVDKMFPNPLPYAPSDTENKMIIAHDGSDRTSSASKTHPHPLGVSGQHIAPQPD